MKIGRYGPVIQIGAADEKNKPLFAHLPKELSMESVTLEQGLELFKLPRMLGQYEGEPVTVGSGRFGPYVLHKKIYTPIPKDIDPLQITIVEAAKLIEEKRKSDAQKHVKSFEQDPKLEILNGRFGPYLNYDGKNIRIPKSMHERAKDLTYEDCMNLVNKGVKAE